MLDELKCITHRSIRQIMDALGQPLADIDYHQPGLVAPRSNAPRAVVAGHPDRLIDLAGLDMRASNASFSMFKHCIMENADFRQADLRNTTFVDCILTGADFRGAVLNGVKLIRCHLKHAQFDKRHPTEID